MIEDALVLVTGQLNQCVRAADILAEMLGYAVAGLASGEEFTAEQLEGARNGILTWRRMRASLEA